MKIKAPGLVVQIFLGMALGILVGGLWKEFALDMRFLSDIFLRLIKMIIAPLVFAVLVVGVANVGDFKSVGRIGLKTIIYFTLTTMVALFIGLLIVNIFEPGRAINLPLPDASESTGLEVKGFDSKNFINHIIPDSVIRAMAENEILPIVVFSIFFGVAAGMLKEKGKPIVDFAESLSHVMFKVTNFVMVFAPLGVFGALSAVVAKQGIEVLWSYLNLILCFYGGLIFFVFGLLFAVCLVFRINFLRLMKEMREALLLAFSTASSEAAMPKTFEALDRFGCPEKITGFVLPLGYSFNMDGSTMYMTFATLFIAQMYGIEMSAGDQIAMMLIFMLTSKGMAGVPRASLVVIAGMLATFKIPTEGLLLVLGVDQILDMGRSATNAVGNAVATAVVSKWEGVLKTPE
jgi:Na+/H+-dicarboxylate symporter